MKKMASIILGATLIVTMSIGSFAIDSGTTEDPRPPRPETENQQPGGGNQYSIEQAMSDNAQLSTIAFSGLAFITGSDGADTFMPPGKVADFFGFQYMRDVDVAGYGHNTTFLTKAASNILYILDDAQKAKLVTLAKEQAPLYNAFAYNRFPMMNAFRRNLEGDLPVGTTELSQTAVAEYTANLYNYDAELSYNRAVVLGEIVQSFSQEQIDYLGNMTFNDSSTWPSVDEDEELKRSMTNVEFVAVMTYASELFSWYKGDVEADIYFCPERHGTYFGGFYMKDYPAMNNPDYFISTSVTGNSGQEFLNILNSEQRALMTSIIEEQRSALNEIAQIRTDVSVELRKAMAGETVDKEKVFIMIERYGELDGWVSSLYANRFAQVNSTLTDEQRAQLVTLRNLDVVPEGAYRFSTPVDMPEVPNTDFLFVNGDLPEGAGQYEVPEQFNESTDRPEQPPVNGELNSNLDPNGDKNLLLEGAVRRLPGEADGSRVPRDGEEIRLPGEGDESRPPRDGDDENRPPRDGDDENRPPRDGDDANRPPRDGDDANRPPRNGDDANRPPRDGDDENRPPRDGDDENRPPRDGDDENRPPRDGDDESRPPRDGDDENKPPRDGDDENRPPRPDEENIPTSVE